MPDGQTPMLIVALALHPAVPVAVTVTLDVPVAVGVPLTMPVLLLMLNPVGNPLAVNVTVPGTLVALKSTGVIAVPTTNGPADVGVIVILAGQLGVSV